MSSRPPSLPQYQRLRSGSHANLSPARGGSERLVTELDVSDGHEIENPLQVEPGTGTGSEAHDLEQRVHSQFLLQFRDMKSLVFSLNAQYTCMLLLLVVTCTLSVVCFVALFSKGGAEDDSTPPLPSFRLHSLAFGSCTAYDLRDWAVFDLAVLPSQVEGWVWTGDFVYLDEGEVNCAVFEPSEDWQASCNCTASWLDQPPSSCHAGDIEYAGRRWDRALRNGPYERFLEYMCPAAGGQGLFPPPGSDPSLCPRPLLGIYDDHDFGWNNGNAREPSRNAYKNLYLDAIGERSDSPRRNNNRPAYASYTLNRDTDYAVDIFLLDERYERETLACETKREYCAQVLQGGLAGGYAGREVSWCRDFLQGGVDGSGSCCKKDEEIFFGWCRNASHTTSPYYRYACDVSFEHFGEKALVLRDGELREPDGTEGTDSYQTSPFCDVLGKQQRQWLRRAVQESRAALQVFVSGSVLFSNPSPRPCGTTANNANATCFCSGDDLDCYRVAQRELLHIFSSLSPACPVVLTGDYHFSDLKALLPGPQPYAPYYNSSHNPKPIYQVMASGLSSSTARPFSCADYRLDPLHLRTHPECEFVTGPNFGRLVFETSAHEALESVRLQILSGLEADRVLLETVVDTRTCQLRK